MGLLTAGEEVAIIVNAERGTGGPNRVFVWRLLPESDASSPPSFKLVTMIQAQGRTQISLARSPDGRHLVTGAEWKPQTCV
jgi:hypothetical protein